MAYGHRERSGRRLRETSTGVDLRLGPELGLLLARSPHPPREPLRGQGGVREAESPRARPDDNLGPKALELLHSEGDGIRAEQSAPFGHAALVGIKSGGHAAVQWFRRRQLDMTDDRHRQQDRTV